MSPSLRRRALLLIIGATALVAPMAAAHGAPNPPEWMTRLLADYNDDFGGPDGHSAVRDGHDLIALDIQEAYNATLAKDTLVFRFALNYGWDGDSSRPELRDVLTFKAKGQTVTRELRTNDNQAFTGTFDAVSAPEPVKKSDGTVDGARFYFSAMVRYETLGVKVGDKLSDFFVQGHAGTAMADHMVGGYTVGSQRIDQEPPSEQSDPQAYRRSEYPLRGPVMYARSDLDKGAATLRPGDNVTVTWRITNTVGRPQTFVLAAASPSGVKVGMHSSQYSESRLVINIQPGVTATVHVYLTASAGAKSGPVGLDLETSLGGHMQETVDVTVGDGAGTGSSTGGSAAAKGSASVALPATLAGLAAAVFVVSRRSR